ncbi:MAG: GNAT family N-acetyltransferase [Chloroflexi bacterium]|nr:GNAT family N-acetyltransferase [Chloroflexota bacterium]
MIVPPIPTARFELVSMSLEFMRRLMVRDIEGAAAEIGAIVPDDFTDEHDQFLRFRIADLSADPLSQPWLGRAVVLTEPDGSRRVVGRVGFHESPGRDGRVEIGYRTEPAFRRQGVAAEVVPAMLDWARNQGVERFRASVAADNVASLAILRRLGFREVGVRMDEYDGEELVFELDP